MSNNVMWLVHKESGQRVMLARHWMQEWKPLDDIVSALTKAFAEQARAGGETGVSPWGSTGWHIEYNRVESGDDQLVPTSLRTDWFPSPVEHPNDCACGACGAR